MRFTTVGIFIFMNIHTYENYFIFIKVSILKTYVLEYNNGFKSKLIFKLIKRCNMDGLPVFANELFLSASEQRRRETIEALRRLDNIEANQGGKVYDHGKRGFVDYDGNLVRDFCGAPVDSLPKNSQSLKEVAKQEHNYQYAIMVVGEITCEAHKGVCPKKA